MRAEMATGIGQGAPAKLCGQASAASATLQQ